MKLLIIMMIVSNMAYSKTKDNSSCFQKAANACEGISKKYKLEAKRLNLNKLESKIFVHYNLDACLQLASDSYTSKEQCN